MYHYVYKVEDPETMEFYIGSRSSTMIPTSDIRYLGSMKTWKPKNKNLLVKSIIESNFKTRELAIKYESELISKQINNPLNRNYSIPNNNFHTTDRITAIDINGKTQMVKSNDPRYLNGELWGNCKNKVNVKDKFGKTLQVDKNDPRYLSGELVSCSKGLITIKNKDGKTYKVSTNDPRYLSGELVGIKKGQVIVKDLSGNKFQVEKDDPRYLSGELVHHTKGDITVKDKFGNKYRINKNDQRYLNGELVGLNSKKFEK